MNITHAIPTMHCYAHGVQCIKEFHQKRIEGTGTVEGEATERIWSLVGRFRSITKEMVPYKRNEQLEDVFRDICASKRMDFLPPLKEKVKKIQIQLYLNKKVFRSLDTSDTSARHLLEMEKRQFNFLLPKFDGQSERGMKLKLQRLICDRTFLYSQMKSKSTAGIDLIHKFLLHSRVKKHADSSQAYS